MRMLDKLKRLITFCNAGELKVENEGAADACKDIVNYAIILAAYAAQWAPISHAGQLHDRASYRFFWQLLTRAHQTGRRLPKEIQLFFAEPGTPARHTP